MKLFFDTSALVKRYLKETGHVQVVALCTQADELFVSVIFLPEIISTFNRLRREGKLSDEQYELLKNRVEIDISAANVCNINQGLLEKTIICLEKQPLRAMDALHLGSALVCMPDKFVSADEKQLDAAINMGLDVINPT